MFERIVGYNNVKEELLRIRNWLLDYLNNENQRNKNVKLPKGIVFYGSPGNGKTLFAREYAESFGVPIINLEGNDENVSREIYSAFKKSKEFDFSIIIIDEIDQLIDRRESVERSLKAELDGVVSNKNVLVLATTNSLSELDNSLLRSGRFDRQIKIGSPNYDSRKELLSYYINKLDISGEFDYDYLSRILCGICCSDVAAILNDVLLRCGNKANTDDIEESYNRIIEKNINSNFDFNPAKANVEVAYHEAAHTLMINKYKENYYFYKALFYPNYQEGYTKSFPVNEDDYSSECCYQNIEISLAGYIITKLKFNKLDAGCIDDLQKARSYAVKLVNKLGANGPGTILPYYSIHERMETEIRRRKNEKEIEKIIRKSTRVVKKYLQDNMDKIELLVNIMMRKGFITLQDINNTIDGKGGDLISTDSESNKTNLVSNAITA